jgi:hypothetical protein
VRPPAIVQYPPHTLLNSEHINTSTHVHINPSTHQRISTTHNINTSTHQHINNTSTHNYQHNPPAQHINTQQSQHIAHQHTSNHHINQHFFAAVLLFCVNFDSCGQKSTDEQQKENVQVLTLSYLISVRCCVMLNKTIDSLTQVSPSVFLFALLFVCKHQVWSISYLAHQSLPNHIIPKAFVKCFSDNLKNGNCTNTVHPCLLSPPNLHQSVRVEGGGVWAVLNCLFQH